MKLWMLAALVMTTLGSASAQWPYYYPHRAASSTATAGVLTAEPGQVAPAMNDARILGTLGASDANEIEAAKLASTKAKSQSIRAFAATLVKAHQLTLQKNTDLSKRLSIARLLPADSVAARVHKAAMDQLNLASGATFDSAFVQGVITEHELDIKVINTSLLPGAKHPSVKAFVQEQLPVLEQHLLRARELLVKP